MGPWYVKKFREKGLDFGVSLIPSISEQEAKKVGLTAAPKSATNIGGNNLVIFDSCRHQQVAYDFLKFITSCRSQLRWCQQLQQIPTNREAADILLGKKQTADKIIEIDRDHQNFYGTNQVCSNAAASPSLRLYRERCRQSGNGTGDERTKARKTGIAGCGHQNQQTGIVTGQ